MAIIPHYRCTTRVLQLLCLIWLASASMVLSGCTYEAAVQRLAPAEQREFHAYRKLMTGAQVRTYLARASAAERDAYMHELGLVQRFQALTAEDRETVLAGHPRVGMSTEAMRFLWGEPYAQDGHANHSEHWYYLGASLGLAAYGNQYQNFGTRVDVYFVDGRVVGWVDFVPTTNDESDDCVGC